MELKEKLELFKDELSLIKTDFIKVFAEFALGALPDYFFEIPASSSGKYHPEYALGKGGLVRHTKAAVRIAHNLMSKGVYSVPKQEVADAVLCALLVHDGAKSGVPKQSYTVTNHPVLVCTIIEKKFNEDFFGEEQYDSITIAQREFIYDLIRTHMGQWGKDFKTGEPVCPEPNTKLQEFVHMCDYLASRKFLPFDFDADFKS